MLKRELRITKKKEFDRIFKEGKSRQQDILGVKLVVNGLTFNRFGLIVSNKVSKLAVDRNRVKRRLRSCLEQLSPKLKIGYDIVVVTRPGIAELSSVDLNGRLIKIFQSLRLFND